MGWIPGLQALVNHGCDLTLSRGCGKRGRPALHIAAENGYVDVVEFIMSQTPPRYHPVLDSSGKLFFF
jgi:hypothetical protein